MPTLVWLITGAGVWLAMVIATCLLLTGAKRADERHQAPSRVLVDGAAGGRSANDAFGSRASRISTIVIGAGEPRLAGRRATHALSARHLRPRGARSARRHERRAATTHAYALHMRGEPAGQLQWRSDPAGAGWSVWRQHLGWRRLTVDPHLIAAFGAAASPPERQQTAELAALVSTARALDAAANLLNGPQASPPRTLPAGYYELHASGLEADIVPFAFPEAIVARRGDISVLRGHFDDLGLAVLTRRIAILGGRVLALFDATSPYP